MSGDVRKTVGVVPVTDELMADAKPAQQAWDDAMATMGEYLDRWLHPWRFPDRVDWPVSVFPRVGRAEACARRAVGRVRRWYQRQHDRVWDWPL